VIDFDPMVEERHMELVRHQDRWKFLDKSSKAGVYLDGVRINESDLLNRESLVEIGNTLLNFRVER
jgi:pSer/pThr/pTyr-binding forkhead associated (FHA) protein